MSDKGFIDLLVTSFAKLFAGYKEKNDINNMIGGQSTEYDIDQFALFDSLHDFHNIKGNIETNSTINLSNIDHILSVTESNLYAEVFENLTNNYKINDQNYLSGNITFTETNGGINIRENELEQHFNDFFPIKDCILDAGNDKVIKKAFGLNFFITDSNIWDSAITRSEAIDRFVDEYDETINNETGQIYDDSVSEDYTIPIKLNGIEKDLQGIRLDFTYGDKKYSTYNSFPSLNEIIESITANNNNGKYIYIETTTNPISIKNDEIEKKLALKRSGDWGHVQYCFNNGNKILVTLDRMLFYYAIFKEVSCILVHPKKPNLNGEYSQEVEFYKGNNLNFDETKEIIRLQTRLIHTYLKRNGFITKWPIQERDGTINSIQEFLRAILRNLYINNTLNTLQYITQQFNIGINKQYKSVSKNELERKYNGLINIINHQMNLVKLNENLIEYNNKIIENIENNIKELEKYKKLLYLSKYYINQLNNIIYYKSIEEYNDNSKGENYYIRFLIEDYWYNEIKYSIDTKIITFDTMIDKFYNKTSSQFKTIYPPDLVDLIKNAKNDKDDKYKYINFTWVFSLNYTLDDNTEQNLLNLKDQSYIQDQDHDIIDYIIKYNNYVKNGELWNYLDIITYAYTYDLNTCTIREYNEDGFKYNNRLLNPYFYYDNDIDKYIKISTSYSGGVGGPMRQTINTDNTPILGTPELFNVINNTIFKFIEFFIKINILNDKKTQFINILDKKNNIFKYNYNDLYDFLTEFSEHFEININLYQYKYTKKSSESKYMIDLGEKKIYGKKYNNTFNFFYNNRLKEITVNLFKQIKDIQNEININDKIDELNNAIITMNKIKKDKDIENKIINKKYVEKLTELRMADPNIGRLVVVYKTQDGQNWMTVSRETKDAKPFLAIIYDIDYLKSEFIKDYKSGSNQYTVKYYKIYESNANLHGVTSVTRVPNTDIYIRADDRHNKKIILKKTNKKTQISPYITQVYNNIRENINKDIYNHLYNHLYGNFTVQLSILQAQIIQPSINIGRIVVVYFDTGTALQPFLGIIIDKYKNGNYKIIFEDGDIKNISTNIYISDNIIDNNDFITNLKQTGLNLNIRIQNFAYVLSQYQIDIPTIKSQITTNNILIHSI